MSVDAASSTGERRWQLRERTAAAHAELDELVGAFDSLASYRRYLAGTARFRLPVETHLEGTTLPGELSDWQPTLLTPLIISDFADLAMEVPAAAAVPVPRDVHEWVGLLYVVEGSSLGARVLAKRAQTIGLGPEFGARHLFPQENGLQSGWRPFLVAMERVAELDIDSAARVAILAFESAINAFRDAHRSD